MSAKRLTDGLIPKLRKPIHCCGAWKRSWNGPINRRATLNGSERTWSCCGVPRSGEPPSGYRPFRTLGTDWSTPNGLRKHAKSWLLCIQAYRVTFGEGRILNPGQFDWLKVTAEGFPIGEEDLKHSWS